MKNAWLLVFLILSGCAGAEYISTHGNDKSPNAPSNESATRGGVMRYGVGNKGHMEPGRSDAYRKMHAFCGGAYTITAESMGTKSNGVVPIGGIYFNDNEESIYLFFRCD